MAVSIFVLMSHWMEQLPWADPITNEELKLVIESRDPTGRPYTGALRWVDSEVGYPIIDGIPRITPDMARKYEDWLASLEVFPPKDTDTGIQSIDSVESLGFRWTWDADSRPGKRTRLDHDGSFRGRRV